MHNKGFQKEKKEKGDWKQQKLQREDSKGSKRKTKRNREVISWFLYCRIEGHGKMYSKSWKGKICKLYCQDTLTSKIII